MASIDFQDLPEERRAVVARLRREIAQGSYETPGRLEGAIEAFLDQSEGNGSGSADKDEKNPFRKERGDRIDPWRPDLFR